MNNNFMFMNYDPRKHPCKDCTKRNAYCHGHCEEERLFNESKPPKPYKGTYIENTRKVKDPFHKKGRVLTNAKKSY